MVAEVQEMFGQFLATMTIIASLGVGNDEKHYWWSDHHKPATWISLVFCSGRRMERMTLKVPMLMTRKDWQFGRYALEESPTCRLERGMLVPHI